MTLAELYHLYGILVYNVALQYTQNKQDAEEVTQDVFVQVNQKMGGFRNESEIKTWIYRIAINKSLDFLKAKKAAKRWSILSAKNIDDVKGVTGVSDFNHPGVQLEQKEALTFLFSCINQLNERQKTVLILVKIEGVELVEAANIMELSYKGIESLLSRAKQNLKLIIAKSKEDEG
ncbi:MAG: RNA polymerase sigma-70 factor (ECF subfamily) [Vicingaceae bacterium]|jgi:RNA polymerase sigma-70 factor (ECF subfamily)